MPEVITLTAEVLVILHLAGAGFIRDGYLF